MQAAKSNTLWLALLLFCGITPLAANAPLSQNSRLGLNPCAPTLHQAILDASPLNALEIAPELRSTRVPSRCSGKERDAETGMDYFGARYMSSAQGRFTSPDAPFADQHPQDPQSWNLYSYVRNNPLRYTDPNGRDCFEGVVSCGNYLYGGVGAIVTAFSSGIINAPNRLADSVVGLFNGGQRVFGDLVPDAFTPMNEDQRQGQEAMNVMLLVSPVAEAGAAKVAELAATGTKVESGVANIAPKLGEAGGPGAGKNFPNSVKNAARAETNNTCVFCQTPTQRTAGPTQSNIDHAIPKSRGGNNTLNNAQNTCRTCNLDKRTRTTQEYEEELRRRQQN